MSGKLVLHSFTWKAIGAIAALFLAFFSSKWLGAEVRGQISLLVSWAGSWVMLTDFISGSALINLSVVHPTHLLRKISFLWVSLVSVCAAIFHYIATGHVVGWFFVPILLFFSGIFNTLSGLLIGQKKMNQRNILFAALSVFTLLLFFVFFKLIFFSDEYLNYMLPLVASWLIVVGLGFIQLRKTKKEEHQFSDALPIVFQVFKQGFFSQTGHLISYFFSRLAFFILPIWVGFSALGNFSNSIVLLEGFALGAAALGQILHFAIIHSQNPSLETKNLVPIYHRMAIGIGILAALFLIFIPAELWQNILGNSFSEMQWHIPWIALAIVFQSSTAITTHALHALNYFKSLLLLHLLSFLVLLILYYLLFPTHHQYAFSMGLALASIFQAIIFLAYYISIGKYNFQYFLDLFNPQKAIRDLYAFVRRKS